MRTAIASVIVTTYNQAEAVKQAIGSVVHQTVPCELIVVDDASTDRTAEIAREATAAVGGTFIQLQANGGVSVARNAGIDAAHGQYVMFLDGDDWIEPTKIATQLNVFAEHPDTAVCYCDSNIVRESGNEPYTLKHYWPPHTDDILLRLLQGNCIAVHAALLPTQLAKTTRFNETLRWAEDWDFWLRLAAAGGAFYYLDRPLVNYRRDSGFTLSRDTANSLEAAWRVLAGLDPEQLTPAQLAALKQYQQGILLAQADMAIRSRRHQDVEALLRQAAALGPLGTYRKLTFQLWPKWRWLARWLYLVASNLAGLRHRTSRPVLN